MSGAVPPLPQYAFMAWCSVKAQGQLYLKCKGKEGRGSGRSPFKTFGWMVW